MSILQVPAGISIPTGLSLRDHEATIVGRMIEFASVGDLDGYHACLDDIFDVAVAARVASAVLDLALVEAMKVSRPQAVTRAKTIEMMAGPLVSDSAIALDTDTMKRLLIARVAWVTGAPPAFDPEVSKWRLLDHCVAATVAVLDGYVSIRCDILAQRAAAALDVKEMRVPEDPFACDVFHRAPVPSIGAHVWAVIRIAANRTAGTESVSPLDEHRRAFALAEKLLQAEARRVVSEGFRLDPVLAHPSWDQHSELWRIARILLMDAIFPGGVGDISGIPSPERVAAVVALLGCLLVEMPTDQLRSRIDALADDLEPVAIPSLTGSALAS